MNATNVDVLNLTPEKLIEMQRDAMKLLPTVMTQSELEAFQRAKDADDRRIEAAKKQKAVAEARANNLLRHANAIMVELQRCAPDRQFKVGVDFDVAYVQEVSKQLSQLPSIHVKLEREASSSRWRSGIPNGKMRAVVGEYGDKVTYPQRKDGSLNYAKIAEEAIKRLLSREAFLYERHKMENTKARNAAVVRAFNEERGLMEYYGSFRVSASAVKDKPAMVKVDIQQAMTFDEAAKLHAALLQLGYVKKEIV